MTTVSVAMATYNGARFIAEQLDSLARQTLLPSELVISDDASSDATLEIVAAFAARAPFPVRIEKNGKQLGYRANFMKLADLCKGDLIAFCDQDDVWLPHKLKTCAAAFENEDVGLVYHNATVVNDTLKPLGILHDWSAPRETNPPQTMGPWHFSLGFTQMFRRRLLDFAPLWAGSADCYHPGQPEAHDQWFFFLAANLATVAYRNEPLALYRQHGRNVFGWRDTSTLRQKWNLLLTTQAQDMEAFERSAAHRTRVLEKLSAVLPDTVLRERARRAAQGYRKLEACYRMRKEVYLAGALTARLRKMQDLLRAGTYRPKSEWGAGRQAFLRDFLRGIVFPRKVKPALAGKQA